MLNYYAQISPVLLPHLKDRCVTRIRWPHGVQEELLREEHAGRHAVLGAYGEGPDDRLARPQSAGDTLVFPIVDDLATLTWLVNLAALELHVHQWTVGRNGRPRQRRPAGHRPRPRRAGRPARVLPGGAAGARQAGRARPGRPAGHQRQQGPAPVRRPAEAAALGRVHRAGEGGRRGAPGRAPQAGHRDDDQGPSRPARCSWTGRRTPARRPRSRRTRCAAGSARRWRPRSPGPRSRRAPTTRSGSSSSPSSEVLDRVADRGDLFAA